MTTQCIDFEMLAGYLGGSLSDDEKIWMMKHISSCLECLEQFASAGEVMNSPHLEEWKPASDEVTQAALRKLGIPGNTQRATDSIQVRLRESVKQLTGWAEGLFRVPRPVLVRSSDAVLGTDCQLNAEFGDIRMTIHLEESEDDNAAIKVMLHRERDILDNISLMLMGESGKLFARNLIENMARFDDIPFDTYQLIVEQNSHERGEYLFEISEEGLYERNLMA